MTNAAVRVRENHADPSSSTGGEDERLSAEARVRNQNVTGCSMLQPSPNGALIDSTSSVLGHETFETITDPDPPTGWIAVNSNGVFGEEIGDLCPGVDVT